MNQPQSDTSQRRKINPGIRCKQHLQVSIHKTVAMYLDSDNTHCRNHFKDLLKSTLSKYKDAWVRVLVKKIGVNLNFFF